MNFRHVLFVFLFLSNLTGTAGARVNVITTTQDLAALAREVGGDDIDVMSMALGYQDPHFVNPKPSYLLKLRRADLLIAVGLELEVGWLPALVQQSRNRKILGGGDGFLNASVGCSVIQQQGSGRINRSMGDVHPFGNPHYWLDPDNGGIIAQNIARKLSALDPENSAAYQSRLAGFLNRLREAVVRWDSIMEPYKGMKVVTYHNSWPNFASRYGIEVVGYVEPKPGVPPSPAHTLRLIQQMKSAKIPTIIVEPYFDLKIPNSIAKATGAKVLILMPSVAGLEEITDYFSLFDYNLNLLASTFREAGVMPNRGNN
ncbi:MAG: zinc ABC transporter substrate-binding protein [Candidatus Latescibacteria bacterium]|jgi:zinc/manganese transport system substrate-binding protein|nr:zinc ABC transporter substrate-binding protein [Candidatus Latescibacterota bacterium]